jgi:hypothetical protein
VGQDEEEAMRDQLVRLKGLQDTDILRKELSLEHATLLQAEDVRKLFNQVNDLQKQVVKLEKDDDRLTMQYKRAEAITASLQSQKQQMESNLYGGTIQNSKEMMQVQSRIQQLQEQIGASEGSSIDCMQAQEDLRREISAIQIKYKAAQAQLTEKRRDNAEAILKLTAQLRELEDVRSKQRSTFDQAILAVYDDLARKKGIAVATLRGDICSGCRVSVPSNKLGKVEEGTALVYCDTCSRLLIPGG